MTFRYPAIFQMTDEGKYTAYFPDLAMCFAKGDTIDECINDAIAECRAWIQDLTTSCSRRTSTSARSASLSGSSTGGMNEKSALHEGARFVYCVLCVLRFVKDAWKGHWSQMTPEVKWPSYYSKVILTP